MSWNPHVARFVFNIIITKKRLVINLSYVNDCVYTIYATQSIIIPSVSGPSYLTSTTVLNIFSFYWHLDTKSIRLLRMYSAIVKRSSLRCTTLYGPTRNDTEDTRNELNIITKWRAMKCWVGRRCDTRRDHREARRSISGALDTLSRYIQ